MPNHKVLIADSLAESGKQILLAETELDDRAGISPEELLEVIPAYNALIVRGRTKVTREVIEAGKNLAVVGRAGVGVDNIDLAAAQASNVIVVNSPTATTTAVVEHTFALLLSMLRRIPQADATMKTGQWEKKALQGAELYGKTLGIIGMGRIGAQVGQVAAGFGMTILGYDPLIPADTILQRGAEPVSLHDLYARADVISLHLPLNNETRNMIDGEALSAMKRGVYLVCAARGGIIDETALLARLDSGQVAGAALDVFAQEPPGLTALVAHPLVTAAPHIGAQTQEAQERASQHIAEEIIRALKGEKLFWQVV
ncbi:MAG: hypothetical protein OEY93_08890 [Anaerolineae bacterium]|nr:hypothetical protein [Anaerolineae bacterium]